MIRRAPVLAALAALAGVACGAPQVEERTRRLSEFATMTAVAGNDFGKAPEGSLREVDDLEVALPDAPEAVQRVRVGSGFARDERVALVAPAGSRYRFRLRPIANHRFRTAVGRAWPESEGPPLGFTVRVDPDGEGIEVAAESAPPEPSARWREVAIDLDRWADMEIELELRVEAATAGGAIAAASPVGVVGAWELPRLVPAATAENPARPRPNIIWISVDTLRADRLGAYGYRHGSTPSLDRFAERGLRFDWAISQAPWTRPSHRSMLTGLYPGARAGLVSPMIGVLLHGAGYRTFAMTGAGQLDSSFGFDQGFETYRVFDWIHEPAATVEWIDSRAGGPFFAFLHTYETHEPYTHPALAAGLPPGRISGEFSKALWNRWDKVLSEEEKRYASALYDGDIAYTDGRLGELFEALEKRNLMASTLIVLTSDHGEQFWEHGSWGHGQNVYDHQIRVPLLVHLPPALGFAAGRAIEAQVELIDLYPTVLDLAGVPLPHPVQGRSLRPLLEARELAPRPAFAEHTNVRRTEQKGLRTPRFKFILIEPRKSHEPSEVRFEFYDLRADPGEQRDLAHLYPERVETLRQEVRRRVHDAQAATDEEVPAAIGAELRKQLEALGYIGN